MKNRLFSKRYSRDKWLHHFGARILQYFCGFGKKSNAVFFTLAFFCTTGYALNWTSLWLTPDQQGQRSMNAGEFIQAAKQFKQSAWQGVAAYRAGNYQEAANAFGQLNNVDGYYNQANALAHLTRYAEAIKAYDKALALNPTHSDALYNRKLVKQLLEKEDTKENNNQKEKNNQEDNQQSQIDKQSSEEEQTSQQENNVSNQDKQSSQNKPSNQEQSEQDKLENQSSNKDKKQDSKNESQKNLAPRKQSENNKALEEKQETQQAKEQWLRLIPDDPGGLMREKFLRDYRKRHNG